MNLDERKRPVSLATPELLSARAGAHLVVTEQDAFLDGYDAAGSRARGTAEPLDRLDAAVAGMTLPADDRAPWCTAFGSSSRCPGTPIRL